MSNPSLPAIPQLPQAGLNLPAEAELASPSLRSSYVEAQYLSEKYLGASEVSVLGVRTKRNAHLDLPAGELELLTTTQVTGSAGAALLYHTALLAMLANQLERASKLVELALSRTVHSEDRSHLLLESARLHLEHGNFPLALAAYQQLQTHDTDAFPLPTEQYDLESVLGAGGFSTVFLCREKISGELVVVKSMDLTRELAQQIDPFHEAELLRQVEHAGIVQLRGYGFADPATRRHPYIVLEHIDGQTLHDYVGRHGPLSWQNWLHLSRQILAALAVVHQAGIIHRDVKPSNLLLNLNSNGWHVKLIDFGIAIRRPMPAGTIGFAAPEQLRRDAEFSTSVDVYAFARTACYALTGKPELAPEQAAAMPTSLVRLLESCQSRTAAERPPLQILIDEVERLLNPQQTHQERSAAVSPLPPPATPTPARAVPTDLNPPLSAPGTWRYEEASNSMARSEQSQERALIVEGDLETRDYLKEILVGLRYEVTTARGASSAQKAFYEAEHLKRPFSLILVSAHLHTWRPEDLLREFRINDYRAHLVLVQRLAAESESRSIDFEELKWEKVKRLQIPCSLEEVFKALEPDESSAPCAMPYMPEGRSQPPGTDADLPSDSVYVASHENLPRVVPAPPITTMSGPAASPAPSSEGTPKPPKTSVAVPPGAIKEPRKTDVPPPQPWLSPAPAARNEIDPILQPTPIENLPRPSGELAMWPREDDTPLTRDLPNLFPPNPFDTAPATQAPRPPRTDVPASPSAAPPSQSGPGFDIQETVSNAWGAVTQKIGGWFKKKTDDRLNNLGKEPPLEDWAQPVGRDFVEPPSRLSPHGPQLDQVDCTVYAPPAMSPGESIMIQALLHLPEQAQLAATMAKQFDDSAVARGARSLDTSIARGSKVAFQLTAPGLDIDEPKPPAIVWNGRPEGVQFGVSAPLKSPHRTVICTVLVTLESVPIGQIKFKLSVQAQVVPSIVPLMSSPASSSASQAHKMSRYRMVFISYASPDRDEVLKRVQMLKRFNVSFFQDVLNLEPGERWEQALYKHIDDSDLFLLFWSTAAKNSKWVREEVKYALSRHAADDRQQPEIVPVVLEGPPVPIPHEELSHLHFNDQIMHFVANRYTSASP